MTIAKYLNKIVEYGILLFVFLVPWQARLILSEGEINGMYWEYGTRSLYATEIILFFVFLAFIIRGAAHIIKTKPRFNVSVLRSPAGVALLLILWAGLSIAWSYDKSIALERWIVLVEAGAVFLILSSGIASLKKIFWAVILSALLQACFGVAQFLIQEVNGSAWLGMSSQHGWISGASVVETELRRWLRAYGTFPHPNILGGWLALGIIVSSFPPLRRAGKLQISSRKLHSLLYCCIVILLFGLLATFSRGAWIAFGIFLIFLSLRGVLYSGRRSNLIDGMDADNQKGHTYRDGKIASSPSFAPSTELRRTPRNDTEDRNDIIKLWIISIAVIAVFSVAFWEPMSARIGLRGRLEAKSNSERVASLRESWQIIKKHSMLGVGIGNYGLAVHNEIEPSQEAWFYQPVHNVFLLVWAELGLLGILAFGVWLLVFLRQTKNPSFLVFLVPLGILSLFDHYLWSLYSGMMMSAVYLGIFWLMLGKNDDFGNTRA